MEKFNKFCEKYITSFWIAVAAIWFYVEFATHPEISSLLVDSIIWTVLAIIEAIRISTKKETKGKKK